MELTNCQKNEYADVIIDISLEKLDKPFSYHIPESLQGKVFVGARVMVPFGKGNTPRKGFVIGLKDHSDYDPAFVKDILSTGGEAVSIEEKQVELAAFIKSSYGGTMNQALKVVLPAKAAVKQLLVREIVCLADRETLIDAKGAAVRKHQNAKLRLIDALLEQQVIPYEWVTGKLGVGGQTISSLVKDGLIRVDSSTKYRNPVSVGDRVDNRKILSEGQKYIVDRITQDLKEEKAGKYLIHGITGSGKTEVYMSVIEDVIKAGKQVIFLIPEIALTYQTLLRFYNRFGDRVSVLNSTLSPGEKYDQCMRAKNGEIDIVIGPRSALFVPFQNLGLIVIDEEHESSYKSEMTPKYHAIRVAEKLADMTGASLVLGSATPSLDSYYKAKNGEYELFTLNERLTGGTLPNVSIIDLREELKEGNKSIFSRKLQNLLADRLEKNEQSILFLNRRGYAGFVSCRACGVVMRCPHCDVSLSEHRSGMLMCHYCGYEIVKPKNCPECGSPYIAGFKAGTEQIEEKLKELFPGIKTIRMDGDTTKTKDSYEKLLSAFANEEAQVLIGTQMIVKGHDFPKVTLVGVLAADLSLNSNDFHSGERTFQLLTQAVGRAGRGSIPGEAVIQTYRPDHYAVTLAADQDYEGFYNEEIDYRRLLGYPPVAHMMVVQIFGTYQNQCERLALELAELLRVKKTMAVLGPTAGNISKIKDMYRFAVYVKSRDYDILVAAKDELENHLKNRNLTNEYVQFDFDPTGSF